MNSERLDKQGILMLPLANFLGRLLASQIGPEQFEKFKTWALKNDKEDAQFDSLEKGIHHLKKQMKSGDF